MKITNMGQLCRDVRGCVINPRIRLKGKVVLVQIGGGCCWNTYERQMARWIKKSIDRHSNTP
jgi:hypothetical protein